MPAFKDITGHKFGRILVLGRAESVRGIAAWNTVCDCGTQKIILGTTLRSGEAVSCGCYRKEAQRRAVFKDLTGKRFGRLVVTSFAGSKRWQVRCECGLVKDVYSTSLISGKTRSCGCIHKSAVQKRPYEHYLSKIRSSTKRGTTTYKFDLNYRDILAFSKESQCHYCLATIAWYPHKTRGTGSDAYNLDRRDNAVGYIRNNCVVCCKRCNVGKGCWYTYEEWWRMTQCFRDDYEAAKKKKAA